MLKAVILPMSVSRFKLAEIIDDSRTEVEKLLTINQKKDQNSILEARVMLLIPSYNEVVLVARRSGGGRLKSYLVWKGSLDFIVDTLYSPPSRSVKRAITVLTKLVESNTQGKDGYFHNGLVSAFESVGVSDIYSKFQDAEVFSLTNVPDYIRIRF